MSTTMLSRTASSDEVKNLAKQASPTGDINVTVKGKKREKAKSSSGVKLRRSLSQSNTHSVSAPNSPQKQRLVNLRNQKGRNQRHNSINSLNSGSSQSLSVGSVGSQHSVSSLGSLVFADDGERDKFLCTVRTKLSVDPKKGVDYLIEKKALSRDAGEIAKFFYEPVSGNYGASKRAIGEYLGSSAPFHKSVLKAFVELHQFEDATFDEALRDFLWRFRLPGEAQQIDRIMECFAHHYHESNPTVFQCADTVYILAFSTIMLNTDLFNPSVKKKMTMEDFIKTHKGINNGEDIPREILVGIYTNISNYEIAIPDDEGDNLGLTFASNKRSGFLTKQGGRRKTWRKRWVVITNNCLYYFKSPEDSQPTGIVPLENLEVDLLDDKKNGKVFGFLVSGKDGEVIKSCKTGKNGVIEQGHHKFYIFSAESAESRLDWIESIKAASIVNPIADLIEKRRNRCSSLSRNTNNKKNKANVVDDNNKNENQNNNGNDNENDKEKEKDKLTKTSTNSNDIEKKKEKNSRPSRKKSRKDKNRVKTNIRNSTASNTSSSSSGFSSSSDYE